MQNLKKIKFILGNQNIFRLFLIILLNLFQIRVMPISVMSTGGLLKNTPIHTKAMTYGETTSLALD